MREGMIDAQFDVKKGWEKEQSFEKYLASQTSKYMPRSLPTVGFLHWLSCTIIWSPKATHTSLPLSHQTPLKTWARRVKYTSNTYTITQIYIQIPRRGLIGSNKVMEDKGRQSLIVKLLAEIIRNHDEIIMIWKPDFLYLLLQEFPPSANHLLLANARIRIPDSMDHNSGKSMFSMHM